MEVATQDLPDVSGFKTHFGIRMAVLGDDGDVLVALGHHEPRDLLNAFNALMTHDLGYDNIRMAFGTPAEAVEALTRSWGRFLTECGSCNGNPECRECRDIKSADWWMNYYASESQPGAFPVTVLDLT